MKTPSISIKTKLGFGFFSITFFTIILGLYSIYTFKQETKLVKNMFNNTYKISGVIKKIHAQSMMINSSMYLLAMNNKATYREDEIAKINKMNRSIDSEFKFLFKEYEGSMIDVELAYKIYKKTILFRDDFFKSLENENNDKLKDLMATSGKMLAEDFNINILVLNNFIDKKLEDYHTLAIENEKSAIFSLIIFLVFLSLLSIVIAFRAIKSISVPLKTLVSISQNISNGILELPNNKEIKNIQSRSDELGEVFNLYYETFTHIMSPYKYIIKSDRNLVEMTAEVGRLLDSFDKYIIASKTDLYGEITYVSKAFEKISGYTKEELVGKPQSLVRHPDMPKSIFKELWETIQSKQTWHGELKNRKKDGGFYWIHAHISPDIDINGNIVGYNAIREDITLRKVFEERVSTEIEKNNKKTQHMLDQSRLALMGEMISMIAHQWRQPLSSISVVSGTLMLDIELDNYNEESFREGLSTINNLTQHLSSTIEDFRGFFKENKKEEISDVKSIVENSVSIISNTLETKDIKLEISYKDNPKVKTHINEIKQVILNLIKNAEDVLIENNIKNAKILLTVQNNEKYVSILVEDNGGGIPEEVRDKVFDPYFSTKKAKEGTGLGLYMSKTIVEEHCNGELLLENKNGGASFCINIPIYEETV